MTKTLIVAGIIWIVLNAVMPLLINSLERLYQRKIDRLVARLVDGVAAMAIRVLQLVLIIVTAPTIVTLALLERIVGRRQIERIRNKSRWFNDTWVAMSLLMRWDFPGHLLGRKRLEG